MAVFKSLKVKLCTFEDCKISPSLLGVGGTELKELVLLLPFLELEPGSVLFILVSIIQSDHLTQQYKLLACLYLFAEKIAKLELLWIVNFLIVLTVCALPLIPESQIDL